VHAQTLVRAAVRVVLPWSTCPMVPMLQWGLLRVNVASARSSRDDTGWEGREASHNAGHRDDKHHTPHKAQGTRHKGSLAEGSAAGPPYAAQ
jgi:hypothetical protein